MDKSDPPKWLKRFLQWLIAPDLFDGIYGDLLENYYETFPSNGPFLAKFHFAWAVLGFVRYRNLHHKKPYPVSSLISPRMLKNHITIASRNLLKQRGYTLINITGLTISFACCILIALYVQDELRFDRYHTKHERLFRIANHEVGASYQNGIAKVAEPWAPEAKETIPEVEEMCRFVFYGQTLFTKDEQKNYEGGGLFADSTVFDLFSWQLLEGDPKTALAAPNSVILTETLARKYFPDGDALGQSILLDNQHTMTITGVLQDIPRHSHFLFRFLVSFSSYTPPDQGDKWVRWNQYYSYVLLEERAQVETVEKKLDEMLDKHLDPDLAEAYTPFLQAIASIHLDSKLHREMGTNGDRIYIYIFSIIGFLILLIACTNFINLFTAKATQRAKEVGVRKVLGANKGLVMQQFIVESMLVCVIAACISLGLTYFVLPSLNAFTGKELGISLFNNPILVVGLLGMVIGTAFISGIYPALVLSSYTPVNALKSQLVPNTLKGFFGKRNQGLLRKSLVTVQFSIATFLIIGALIVTQQFTYIQTRNLGFNKDQIINVPMSSPETIQKAAHIKAELQKMPGVLNVSVSANRPGGSDYGVPVVAKGVSPEDMPPMRCLVVDEDFLATYDMHIMDGRGFSKDFGTDSTAYLINETAARQLGWENPVGKLLSMPAVDREAAPVIGVVKDFNFRSLHQPIGPLYFFMEKAWFSQFNIKLDAENINETLAMLQEKWPEFEPKHPFRYTFFDDTFGALHAAEQRSAQIIRWFTIIAVFITCLGLLGLATFTSERRTKEIGIRKVLGASVPNILLLLSKEVLILVGIAFLVAAPFAWYVGDNWLNNYAYSIELGPRFFLLAGLMALTIALLTVSYHALKSAFSNPVHSLRFE